MRSSRMKWSLQKKDCAKDLFGARRAAEVLLAYWNDQPAGFALFFHNFSTFVGKPGIYLEDLFVEPSHRGRGIGKALLAKVARIANERGCGRLEWAVLDWNHPAIEFYRSVGAVAMDEWTVFRLTGDAFQKLATSARPGAGKPSPVTLKKRSSSARLPIMATRIQALHDALATRILVLDGAMGTMIHQAPLVDHRGFGGAVPELPRVFSSSHAAGCDRRDPSRVPRSRCGHHRDRHFRRYLDRPGRVQLAGSRPRAELRGSQTGTAGRGRVFHAPEAALCCGFDGTDHEGPQYHGDDHLCGCDELITIRPRR